MPTSRISRSSQWGLGIACIIGLAACGTAGQPAAAPTSQPALQAATHAAAPTTTAPTAIPTAAPPTAGHSMLAATATAAQPPAATPKETPMPDQKPPVRPTLQVESTLVPEGAALPNTPVAAPPATTLVSVAPAELAKADLARRRGVALDTIRVVEVLSVTWPDPGLGCPQPGMAYKQVPVDGLLIRLESGGQLFEYHSGGRRAPFLCEQPAGGDKPTPVSGGEGQ